MKRTSSPRRTLALVVSICFVVFMATAFASCTTSNSGNASHISTLADDAVLSDKVYCYYYDQLNSTEKELYDGLLASIEDGTDLAAFDAAKADEYAEAAERVLEALHYDHAEHFAYNGSLQYYQFDESVYFQMDKWSYWQYSSSYETQKKTLDNIVNDIAKTAIIDYDTDYERAQFVHDYLVQHAVYDYDALYDVVNHPTSYNPSNQPVFTAYGCLVNGRCVCAGYAHAYKLILDKLDIPCVYVTGWGDPTNADSGHAWNRVTLDGESFYVDITWDDNMLEMFDEYGHQRYPEAAAHNYFGLTTDELLKTHRIDDESFTHPVCTSDKYYFYKYYDLIMDSYDLDSLIGLINKQRHNNPVSIKFTRPADAQRALDDFIQNQGYNRVTWLSTFSYFADQEDGYMYILF